MKFLKTLPVLAGAAVLLSACADHPIEPSTDSLLSAEGLTATHSLGSEAANGRYIILMKRNAVPADFAARIEAAGGQLVHTLPQVGIAIASGTGPEFVDAISADNRVASIGPEPVTALPEIAVEIEFDAALFDVPISPTPADDLFNAGWVWGVERVNAPAAWAHGPAYTGQGAVIGVLDTGIASNHPDLGQNIVFNSCFSSSGDVVGRDWQADDPCNPYPSLSDPGTHVAGTVAARFGGGRVVGVAPNASLANYNVFEWIPGLGTRSYTSSRWRAMIHAADTGVDAINMSLGSFTFIGNDPKRFEERGWDHDPTRQNGLATLMAAESRVANYVTQRGTVIISSAGNSAADLNGTNVALPGQTQGHLTVGATGLRPNWWYQPGVSTDVLAGYSNFGAAIDVAAPGGDCGPVGCVAQYLVLSTIVQNLNASCAETQSCTVWYGWKGGTSMAAPHVAGVAAIVRAVNPRLSANQVNATITRTADRLGDRQSFGHGMVDAAAAAGIR